MAAAAGAFVRGRCGPLPRQRDAARSQDGLQRALSDLKRAAQGTQNVLPHIVSAVKVRATLGEIADALREVFGEHRRS